MSLSRNIRPVLLKRPRTARKCSSTIIEDRRFAASRPSLRRREFGTLRLASEYIRLVNVALNIKYEQCAVEFRSKTLPAMQVPAAIPKTKLRKQELRGAQPIAHPL